MFEWVERIWCIEIQVSLEIKSFKIAQWSHLLHCNTKWPSISGMTILCESNYEPFAAAAAAIGYAILFCYWWYWKLIWLERTTFVDHLLSLQFNWFRINKMWSHICYIESWRDNILACKIETSFSNGKFHRIPPKLERIISIWFDLITNAHF